MGRTGHSVRILWYLPIAVSRPYCRTHLSSTVEDTASQSFKRSPFTSDVAVQTDNVLSFAARPVVVEDYVKDDVVEDDDLQLSSTDLTSILKWSKEISSDINLSSGEYPFHLSICL